MKILFLQKRILFPTDTGGKIRTLNVLRHLARWHEVTYLCNLQANEEPYTSQMHDLGLRLETIPWNEAPRGSLRFYRDLALNLASRYPFNVNKDFDRRLRQRATELLAESSYDLVICDFVQMARNAMGLPAPASLLFQHNVEAQIFARHAANAGSWAQRNYMWLQWKKMFSFEGAAGQAFDRVIAVSEQDRETFSRDYGWPHVNVIDTAVDTEYFQPRPTQCQQPRVVFVGSLDWLANQDGVEHFVQTAWPRVTARVPEARFQIVGRNPPAAMKQLEKVAGVELVGTVPDIRPYLADAAVVVVPLRVGGGTRLKIFEAMAMGKAVVSTGLGAEGLEVEHGKHLLLADAPGPLAHSIVQLLTDPARRAAIGAGAQQLVLERFSAETVARQFDAICRDTVDVRLGRIESKLDTRPLANTLGTTCAHASLE